MNETSASQPESNFHVFSVNQQALESSIEISEGRVRGTRIFSGDGATVMSMAMDAGAVLKEHRAPVPILIQIMSGEAEIAVAGEKTMAPAGTVMHIEAGIVHELTAGPQTRFLLTLLSRDQARPQPVVLEKPAGAAGTGH